jgi:hypothetical protein
LLVTAPLCSSHPQRSQPQPHLTFYRHLRLLSSNFINSGTDTLTQLLNGFNTGMTPQQADALLQTFMDTTAFNFHQTAEKVLGTGTGDTLKVIMEALRLTEKWAVNPSTGAITHQRLV